MQTMGDDEHAQLSVRTAYLSMFEFLHRYYERGQSDEIGTLLGAMSLLADGGSVDPAMFNEFGDSVREVMRDEAQGGYQGAAQTLRPPKGGSDG